MITIHRFAAVAAIILAFTASGLRAAEPVKLDKGRFVFPEPIRFETGSDKLVAESLPMLDEVKDLLNKHTDFTTVRVESHTDNTGPADANLELTKNRSLAIVKYLAGAGVDRKRLIAVGFGGTKPIEANDTPEGKAKNRRTEIVVAALRGHAIGGMPLDGGGAVAEEKEQ